MTTRNKAGEFISCSSALDAGGALLELVAPIDLLDPLMKVGDTFEAVQFLIGASGNFDFSRDNVNWVTQAANSPLILSIERSIPCGETGGTVFVPKLWVKGAVTVGVIVHGDIKQNSVTT